jgi:hypothetical protein
MEMMFHVQYVQLAQVTYFLSQLIKLLKFSSKID